LLLCLQAITNSGDAIAVESPGFYLGLQAAEMLGLRVVEIPVDPREGIDLSHLATAIEKHAIKACWVMSNFQNPVGTTMPAERKRELVALLQGHDIPLIEDDAYAELYFGDQRPLPAKAFDRAGLVMHCGSFAKCLAPGYRVGWVAPGRFERRIRQDKFLYSIETNVIAQAAIAQFIKGGGYEHHLRQLRRRLQDQQSSMLRAITRYFPSGTRVTRPAGGYFVWLEVPGIDALELYHACVAAGVSIAPGPIFSPQRRFQSYIRLNYGYRWGGVMENAVATVGNLVSTRLA
jgi:DNA-binding transcriptional MocR family regulator